jgi:polyisoprenyl-phosphate glycosyltransferase
MPKTGVPASEATSSNHPKHPMLISIVIPLLNEQDTLIELHDRLVAVIEHMGCDREIIFVDDGSTDDSAEIIRTLAAIDPTVIGLRLSRNFGHEAASTAGLDIAHGDVTILMDADLQDPPELIGQMLDLWRQDHQVVYAVRRHRAGESFLKKSAAWLFYRAVNFLSDVPIPKDTGDFRLMDARVVRSLCDCREHHRFVRGLVAWTGFRSIALEYDRPARASGTTHYGLWKLFFLSLDAFVGFSISPLRLASFAGAAVLLTSILTTLTYLIAALSTAKPLSPIALLAAGLFFLAGMQLLCLGILGEYIARIFRQGQNRPLYLITEEIAAVGLLSRHGQRPLAA